MAATKPASTKALGNTRKPVPSSMQVHHVMEGQIRGEQIAPLTVSTMIVRITNLSNEVRKSSQAIYRGLSAEEVVITDMEETEVPVGLVEALRRVEDQLQITLHCNASISDILN